MAFNPRLTIDHGLEMTHDIDKTLDEAELDPTTSETIKRVAGHVRYYADLEDENVLSDIEYLKSEVADIPIIDDPEDRLNALENEVADLKQYIQEFKANVPVVDDNSERMDELENEVFELKQTVNELKGIL